METITMKDGTEIQGGYVIPGNGRLWFYVNNGMTMAEVFALFNNPEKTDRISCSRNTEEVFEGYTDLFTVQKTGSMISGGLARNE